MTVRVSITGLAWERIMVAGTRRLARMTSVAVGAAAFALFSCTEAGPEPLELDPVLVAEGKEIFRYDTFGDEQYWTDTLRMHEVIDAAVSPRAALGVGLKVDVDALPQSVRDALAAGQIDLDDPAVTVTLLKLNAVVGAQGVVETINGRDTLTRFGITCALCHSTVDNSFAPGIGKRLDGWPNTTLNPGAIVALSPAVDAATKAVLNSWGPGKYDPRINFDGQNTPLVLPPAYGLLGVDKETFTAEGPVSYWNAYVAVTQMHAQGNFSDPRLGVNIVQAPDLVTAKLPALREYQLSLTTPQPPAGSFDAAAAQRGRALFTGTATCASCHTGTILSDVNTGKLHAPAETGMDGAYAARTTQKAYRTTPLRGLWQHAPYFHDGSAATLADVVEHYNSVRSLNLTDAQKRDLVEYLKSL
jgi:mono/diheme cytochrome c family protein/cytochrome c5